MPLLLSKMLAEIVGPRIIVAIEIAYYDQTPVDAPHAEFAQRLAGALRVGNRERGIAPAEENQIAVQFAGLLVDLSVRQQIGVKAMIRAELIQSRERT